MKNNPITSMFKKQIHLEKTSTVKIISSGLGCLETSFKVHCADWLFSLILQPRVMHSGQLSLINNLNRYYQKMYNNQFYI